MATQINHYPLWKYILIVVVLIAGFIYAAPMLYGEYPAVQVMGANAAIVDDKVLATVDSALKTANVSYQNVQFQGQTLLYRFASTDTQLKAKEVIQEALGDNYLVAINLAPATPEWLKSLGAMPMKLGLDLRGGVHFLLQVDVDSVMKQRVEGDLHNIGQSLRDERIRYSGITRKSEDVVVLQFRTEEALNAAYSFVTRRYNEFMWDKKRIIMNFLCKAHYYLPRCFKRVKIL